MEIVYSETGSGGNATIITDGESYLLIDCGLSVKQVNKGGYSNLSNVKNALLTHSHMDHVKYLKNYVERGITFHCSEETKIILGIKGLYDGYYCKSIKSLKQFEIETFIIKPFELPHTNPDGTDCHNLGFFIYSKVDKKKMLYVTDTHYIPQQFPPCENYVLECNYSEIENFENEMEYITPVVEGRRMKSHMSLETLKLFLSKQDLSKCEWIKLVHGSKTSIKSMQEMKEEIQQLVGEEIEVII